MMLTTLAQLEQLETEKRNEKPGTDRFKYLAAEIERLASQVFAHTHKQRQLADMSKVVAQKTGADLTPIAEVKANRDVRAILAEWRAAERIASESLPGSAQQASATADANRLRDEYQRAYESTEDNDVR